MTFLGFQNVFTLIDLPYLAGIDLLYVNSHY